MARHGRITRMVIEKMSKVRRISISDAATRFDNLEKEKQRALVRDEERRWRRKDFATEGA